MSQLIENYETENRDHSNLESPDFQNHAKEEIVKIQTTDQPSQADSLSDEQEDILFLLYDIASSPISETSHTGAMLPQNISSLELPSVGDIVQRSKQSIIGFLGSKSESFITRLLG